MSLIRLYINNHTNYFPLFPVLFFKRETYKVQDISFEISPYNALKLIIIKEWMEYSCQINSKKH